jgi:hypothetical protein
MVESAGGVAFTSLVVYRNLDYRYSFLYPEEWHRFELAVEGGQGVILAPSPDPAAVATSFSVEARDLGTTVTGADLPALRRGLLAGLRRLRGLAIEHQEDYVIGDLVGLEARHTFRERRLVRQRWVRLLYQETRQLRLIAQGATVAEYTTWLAAFGVMMHSFRFGDWWADATGVSWATSLDALTPEAAAPSPPEDADG